MPDTARIDAMALADVLARHPNGDRPETVAVLPELGWSLVAAVAGLPAPAERVRRMTLAIVRDRAANPDPFAGFPREVLASADRPGADLAWHPDEEPFTAEAVDDAIDARTEDRHERQATQS